MHDFSLPHFGKDALGPKKICVQKGGVFSFPAHLHAYCEMTFYEPFPGAVTINGKRFETNKKMAVYMSPYDFHEIDVREDCGANFMKVAFDESVIFTPIPKKSFIYIEEGSGFAESMFNEIYLSASGGEYNASMVTAAVNYIARYGNSVSPLKRNIRHEMITSAAELLNLRFTDGITLSDLSSELSVSPQYLSKVFSEETGTTFIKYLCTLRLERACNLLSESNMSVTEVCFACGYKNLSHFLRSFKKSYGMTPAEYRKSKAIDIK